MDRERHEPYSGLNPETGAGAGVDPLTRCGLMDLDGRLEAHEHNRAAWNRLSAEGSRWTTPVDSKTIEWARRGEWEVVLTPDRAVPRSWFGDLREKRVLCLASGGGQQAPILAAAGAMVVSLDLSEEQLSKDRAVAAREGLSLQCIQGDMADLSVFADASFDLVFNPISTVFVPDVAPVWTECHRVLRPGGTLLSGFMNPCFFLFDHESSGEADPLVVKHRLPYSESDLERLAPARRRAIVAGEAMEFSHSLDALIGGQLAAGFHLIGFYEDWWDDEETPLNRFTPTSMATRAVRVESEEGAE
jgi:SAM-dependent methyltransferase